MSVEYVRRAITVDEFHRMDDAGIFGPDERVELLDGELIAMAPMNPPHAAAVERLNFLLVTRLGERVSVRPALPSPISRVSEPLPDFALVTRRADFHASAHPTPADTLALVECSDTSLRFDRGRKGAAYARAGIAEYWIVNLVDRRVEIFREPNELGFGSTRIAVVGESLAFLAFPDVAFTVAELVGAA